MERRRVAAVLAGLVVVGGAVALLRATGSNPDVAPGPVAPPMPTTLRAFAAEGVIPPSMGAPPGVPVHLSVTPGPHRLQLHWSAPPGATGYEVSWGQNGQLSDDKLVSEPDAELDGLPTGQDTEVQVRAVDAFGQRSAPANVTGKATGDPGGFTFADHFDGALVPDPRLWRLAGQGGCASAGPGTGEDSRRLVILANCGSESLALRGRTPFVLSQGPGGVLGRFTVDTDAPGEDGQLDLDLVPGPADLIDDSPTEVAPPASPNEAADDPALPPGTIRVRIDGDSSGPVPRTTVAVYVAPGTPRLPETPHQVAALPKPATGISVRWDVVLRTDGVRVLRDGADVGGANVAPQWTQATALVGFVGPGTGQLRAGVSLIGFTGGHASAPPLLPPPTVSATPEVSSDAGPVPAVSASNPVRGASGGQLRLTLLPQANSPTGSVSTGGTPNFTVVAGGHRYPATAAVPGTVLSAQVRYPIVAQLPASALLTGSGGVLPVTVLMTMPAGYQARVYVVQADLELTPAPGTRLPAPVAPAPIRPSTPHLAVPSATVANAAGIPAEPGTALPHGRIVLTVTLDGPAGQRADGSVGGLAGFEVWLDGDELAIVSTTADGPGVAGQWPISFDTNGLATGPHSLDIRAYGTSRASQYVETFASFTLGP